MHAFVTGCAGFIGSNLVDELLKRGTSVTGFDNRSTGKLTFLEQAHKDPNFSLVRGDIEENILRSSMQGADIVYHFAANADVRSGLKHPRKDLEKNTLATLEVLEAMRDVGVRKIVFPSSATVYGRTEVIPTPEDAPFPIQTSLYGASKLACEGLIAAYAEGYGMQGYIFRFVSILGERYTHGHVFDFVRALSKDPTKLHILGDGTQRKSYLYVGDCIDAMLMAVQIANDKVNIFNLGTDEYSSVTDNARWIAQHLGISPQFIYSGGDQGWTGDNTVFLDISRIQSLGWKPKLSIQEGIERTVDWIKHEGKR